MKLKEIIQSELKKEHDIEDANMNDKSTVVKWYDLDPCAGELCFVEGPDGYSVEDQAIPGEGDDMKKTASKMIMADLIKAGFDASINMFCDVRVSLTQRKPSLIEIDDAMQCAGYDPCQYSLSYSHGDYIVVYPIIG